MKIIKITTEMSENLGKLIQFALKGAQTLAMENATKQIQDIVNDINKSMEEEKEDDKQIESKSVAKRKAAQHRKDGTVKN